MTGENSMSTSGVSVEVNTPSTTPPAESADTAESATDSEVTTSPGYYMAVTGIPGSGNYPGYKI